MKRLIKRNNLTRKALAVFCLAALLVSGGALSGLTYAGEGVSVYDVVPESVTIEAG